MGDRVKIINSFYDKTGEDSRLLRSRHGQLEYLTTMHYIHKFVPDTARILEVGAGTGRYSCKGRAYGYRDGACLQEP